MCAHTLCSVCVQHSAFPTVINLCVWMKLCHPIKSLTGQADIPAPFSFFLSFFFASSQLHLTPLSCSLCLVFFLNYILTSLPLKPKSISGCHLRRDILLSTTSKAQLYVPASRFCCTLTDYVHESVSAGLSSELLFHMTWIGVLHRWALAVSYVGSSCTSASLLTKARGPLTQLQL